MPILRKTAGASVAPKAILRKTNGVHVDPKAILRKTNGVYVAVWTGRTIRIYVSGSNTIRQGTGINATQYDQIIFAVEVSDRTLPTTYTWSGDVSGSAPTAVFNGPRYSPSGYSYLASGTVSVSVVIEGVTLTASLPFTYTAGDIF